MARKFLTAIDLAKNELQNGVVQNLASAPSSPVKGQIYFDSTTNILYWYSGTVWVPAQGGVVSYGTITAEQSFGASKADGVATTLARSDHAHGNPTHVAADHATIPINSFALAAVNAVPVNMNQQPLIQVPTPTLDHHAANKGYVDNVIAGLVWKKAVRVASTTTTPPSGLVAVDGVTVAAGDRVLIKDWIGINAYQNGIYIAASGIWMRATDADSETELVNAAVFVSEGTVNKDTAWVCVTDAPIVVGTTNLGWAQFAGGSMVTAGAGMTQTGNTLNVIGDATVTVGADVLGVADDGVGNTKLANMAQSRIKGRSAGSGTGDPEDLSGSQVATILLGIVPRTTAFLSLAAASTLCTHNLATNNVVVEVYRNSTPWDSIECDVERTSTNSVTVRFASAVAANEYMIVILG